MNRRQPQNDRRAGFTLVELMIVIAIIAILVALLVVGIGGLIGVGREAKNFHEIKQLEIAVQGFKNKYKVYPPSWIRLKSPLSTYDTSINPSTGLPNNPLDVESLQYLTRIWPRINNGVLMDWTGNGPALGTFELNGDQCLVFFLAGIADSGGGFRGFSSNPRNPTDPDSNKLIPPLFDFGNNRLVNRGGSPFYSYLDVFGDKQDPSSHPYVYFTSGKKANGYNLGHGIAGLENVGPYQRPINKFLNPNTFQIISAGADKVFGPGGIGVLWTPGQGNWAVPTGAVMGNGYDDMANFSSNKLGVEP